MELRMSINITNITRFIQLVSSINFANLGKLWSMVGWKRLIWAVGAAVVAGIIAFGYMSHKRAEGAQRALEAKEIEVAVLRAERAGNQAAQDVVSVERPRVTREYADRRADTEKALEANADWANQPIPDDVLASIVRH